MLAETGVIENRFRVVDAESDRVAGQALAQCGSIAATGRRVDANRVLVKDMGPTGRGRWRDDPIVAAEVFGERRRVALPRRVALGQPVELRQPDGGRNI